MTEHSTTKDGQDFLIILFYKYVRIENPTEEMARQRDLCEQLGFKGRMIIAGEGINATLEGTSAQVRKYQEEMGKDERFKGIHWKKSVGTGSAFPKLKIKVRPEIVSLHLDDDIDVGNNPAPRLKP